MSSTLLEPIALKRIFNYPVDGVTIPLDDPDPDFTPEEVLNHWAFTYPELNNARVSGGEVIGEQQEFTFTSVFGTKG